MGRTKPCCGHWKRRAAGECHWQRRRGVGTAQDTQWISTTCFVLGVLAQCGRKYSLLERRALELVTSDSLWQQTRRVGGCGEDGGRLSPWDGRMFLCFVHSHSGYRGATLSLIVTSPCGLSPSFHPCIVLENHNFICCSYNEARSTMKSRLQNVRCMSTKETKKK